MPVGLEEWRASVGSNNAARSHALGKLMRRKNPRNFLCQFISYLVALLTEGTWFASWSTSEPCTITSHSPDVTTPTTCSSTHKNKKIGVVVTLCIGLFIAIVAGVLYRSGDIETNPGPKYDLIPDNLGKVQNSLWNARTKWFNLGLRLGIEEETLTMLKRNYPNGDDCFREMLSKWLRTVNPTWEKLLVALKHPSVGCDHIAKKVRDEQGNTSLVMDLRHQLKLSRDEIKTHYASYIYGVYQLIIKKGVSVEDFLFFLKGLPGFGQDMCKFDSLPPEPHMRDVFEIIGNKFSSYLHYEVFEHILNKFANASEKDCEMFMYPEYLKLYIKQLNIEEFIKINPNLQPSDIRLIDVEEAVTYFKDPDPEADAKDPDVGMDLIGGSHIIYGGSRSPSIKNAEDHVVATRKDANSRTVNYDLYKKALAEGSTVPMQYLKCYLIGIPQIGKTTVMKRLADEIHNLREIGGKAKWKSTGIAECSYMQVKQMTIKSEDRSNWSIPKDELQEAIKLYYNTGSFEASTVTAATASENEGTHVHNDSVKAEKPVTPTPAGTQPSKSNTSKISTKVSIPKDIRDIVNSFNRKLKETDGNILISKEVQMLLMIDVGGQSSFLEMLPLIMKGPAIYLTFFKLSENPLEDSYFDKYSKEPGIVVDGDKRAQYTVGDAIIQILSNVALSRHPNEQVRKLLENINSTKDTSTPYESGAYRTTAFLIGTHKDLLMESLGHETELIDAKLGQIDDTIDKRIKEVFGYDLVAWAACETQFSRGKLMFAMDNMNGGDKEIQDLRSRLMDEIKKIGNFHIPVRWLLFGIILRKEYEWITIEDCISLAQSFDIPEENVDAVLWFLSSVTGMLLYQPDIEHLQLKRVIFCNPQTIFNSISKLIILNIYDKSGDMSWIKCMKENGKFYLTKLDRKIHMNEEDSYSSSDNLQHSVRRRHDQEHKLVPIHALVDFLQYRKIVAPLSKGQEKDLPYIMPAALDYGPVDHLKCQDDAPSTLYVRFLGYVPPGIFSCLITKVFNEYDSECIAEVKRNIICFRDNGRKIALIASSKCYEVRVLNYDSESEYIHELCVDVKVTVLGLIHAVMEDLSFKDKFNFFIKCDHTDPTEHYIPINAILSKSKKDGTHYIRCNEGHNTRLPEQLCWFNHKNVSDSIPSTATSCKLAENPTMMELVNFPSSGCKLNLAVEVGDHYFRFGTLLLEDTDGSRINAFESELLKNAEKINQRIFTLWLKGMGKKPVTWSTLIGVLQELGLDKLAKIITNAKQ